MQVTALTFSEWKAVFWFSFPVSIISICRVHYFLIRTLWFTLPSWGCQLCLLMRRTRMSERQSVLDCMWQVILVDELLKFFSRRGKGNVLLQAVWSRLVFDHLWLLLYFIPWYFTFKSDIVTLIFQVKFRALDSGPTIYYQRVTHGNSSCFLFNCRLYQQLSIACYWRTSYPRLR